MSGPNLFNMIIFSRLIYLVIVFWSKLSYIQLQQ